MPARASRAATSQDTVTDQPQMPRLSRRMFLASALLVAGCGPQRTVSTLPGVPWPAGSPAPTPGTVPSVPQPVEPQVSISGVLPRNYWAKGAPDAFNMNRLDGIRYITVHHDGMTPFFASDQPSIADRIELIRVSHRNRGWADIGYHFVVDRAGNVWEARPLNFQGAHVGGYNEQNIGVLTLGNFDEQSPTDVQLAALRRHVAALMRQFRVSGSNVRTHQEWSVTACPGRHLQRYMVSARHNGLLA